MGAECVCENRILCSKCRVSSEMAEKILKASVMINNKAESNRRVYFHGGARELMEAIKVAFKDIGVEKWKTCILQIHDPELGFVLLEDEEPITEGQKFNVVFPDGKPSIHSSHSIQPCHLSIY